MNEAGSRWRIILTRQAEKTLYRLPRSLLQRFDRTLLALAENPRPPESHPLGGHDNLYRLAIDEWRLTYSIEEERLSVLILEIAPQQQPERYRLEEEAENLLPEESPHHEEFVSPTTMDLAGRIFDFGVKFGTGDDFYYRTPSLLKRIRREKIRLFIVDDLAETRENLRKLLRLEPDIDVVGMAASGEEAVQRAAELQPDIVLMDMVLPGIDGLKATEIISQQVPAAQVIVMSVHGEADYLRRALLAGAKEFLIKPFSRDELMTSIHRVYQSIARQKGYSPSPGSHQRDSFHDLKRRIQDKLRAELDPTMEVSRPDEVQRILLDKFERILTEENIVLSRSERGRLFEDIVAEILGSASSAERSALEKIDLLFLSQALEREEGELDEVQKRALTLWFKFFKLGHHLEISLSVTDLPESLNFYSKLGFERVDGGQKPYPWTVVSDGRFYLGLHQQPFSSPTLSYFQRRILQERREYLQKLGLRLDNVQTLDLLKFMAAELWSPEGQRVLLADISAEVETTPTRRVFYSRYGPAGELSLRTEDVKAAATFWKQVGFERVAEGQQPYPWAILSDSLIRLSFHQTPKLSRPTITYFAPDMPDRLKRFHEQGLKFVAEQKDKQGRRVGAVIESPDGQLFFLMTGKIESPRREAGPQGGHQDSQPRPEGSQWYLIYGHSGYEHRVQKNLLDQIEVLGMQDRIFQVIVPAGEMVQAEGFRGAVLIEMAFSEDTWSMIRNTPGVTGFLGAGDKPTPLPSDEVHKILKQTGVEEFKTNGNFRVGQQVRILDGPFADFIGIVAEVDSARTRLRVQIDLFGRETPIEVNFSQAEAV